MMESCHLAVTNMTHTLGGRSTMKFKRRDAQNQRIERITTEHLVVGIDIAKETHVARAVNYRGLEIGRHLTFSNSHEGFEKLLRWIQSLQSQHGLSQLIIGLEPTGHYWLNLGDWLVSRDVDIVLVNPLTTKRNKENRDNSQSKNDVKDALVIADLVCRGYYSSYTQHAPVYQRLRMVMNEREYWANQKTSINNRLVRWLDLFFPEYTSVFKEWDCPRSLATLKEFPLPSDLRDLSAQEVIAGWKKHMKRSGGCRGVQKATQLLDKARHTVSVKIGQEEARRELKRLLDEYERLSSLLEQIEQEVLALLKEIPDVVELLQSIKGLSPLMIAAILAGTGDLRKYIDGRQVLSHAGLNLAEDSSGKHKGKIVISKRGRRQLRKYLYLAVIQLVANNPAFREWHYHNVHVKKMKKHRSIFKLIGKLTRIMVGMVRHQEKFSPSKAAPLQQAA